MLLFPDQPDPAHLADLHARFPASLRPLMDCADGLLRGDGALSVGKRELIATYVSALNACMFCAGAHRAYAEAPDGHPAHGSRPEEQAHSYGRFGDMVAQLAKG